MKDAERGRHSLRSVGRAGIALFALAFVLQHAAARAPDTVERVYSRGIYPSVAAALGGLSDAVPFALAEWMAAATLVFVARAAWQRARGIHRRQPRAGAALAAVLAVVGWTWFAFLLVWGLNYRRLPLAASAGLDTRPPTPLELTKLCQALVGRTNQLRVGLPEDARGVMRLRDGRDAMLKRTARGSAALRRAYPWLVRPGAGPKLFAASPLFSYLGISGLYVPFSAEAHVNATLPDPELPFVAAHELAHRQGYAREDEANYLGYVACRLHPDGDFRYAGALAASVYALGALARADQPAYDRIVAGRSAPVRRDLAAFEAWSQRYRSPVSELARAVNHAYLRSQGQPAGVASYGRMVDLLIAEHRTRMRRAPRRASRPGPSVLARFRTYASTRRYRPGCKTRCGPVASCYPSGIFRCLS